jgi:cyclopropane fatty-acyl-phospholipid synthase-like methyltransferase
MRRHGLGGPRVVEVGCGAGGVLAALARALPEARFQGYDIAPDAARLWPPPGQVPNLQLEVGDFLDREDAPYDLALVLDVVEHVGDPLAFLDRMRPKARHHILHFPLDLSAFAVLRGTPLMHAREKVGHLHFYTKDLALALLADAGYEVMDWTYTGAAFSAPQRTWRTRLAGLPRRLAYTFGKDAGVRLLGGETLMVLARAARVPTAP